MPEARKLCGEICLGFLRKEGIFWTGGVVHVVHLQPESSKPLCMLCLPQHYPALSGACCDAETTSVVKGASNSK